MCLSIQKKELINLKNTINEFQKNKNDKNQWVLDFSVVKILSIWEQIIRYFAEIEFSKIDNNIKIKLDKKRFNDYVWRSWIDGKQKNIFAHLQVKNVKRYRDTRNKIAHGNLLDRNDKDLIDALNNDNGLLYTTLKELEKLKELE